MKLKTIYIFSFFILSLALIGSIQAKENKGKEDALTNNRYIVVFKDSSFVSAASENASTASVNKLGESVSQAAKRLVREVAENQIALDHKNGTTRLNDDYEKINKIGFIYQKSIKGFSAALTNQAIAVLKKNPLVDYIENDGIASVGASQYPTPSWGIDRIDQRNLPLNQTFDYDRDGTGVHVYVIDTGVEKTHDEFTERMGNGADFIDNDDDANDNCNGHGTHVAGTIAGETVGVAKNATIHPVRVLDCDGRGTWSQVIAGIEWVRANAQHPAVANMSLGGGGNLAADTAVANSVNAGITFVVSAGNNSADACGSSPARAPNAITVTSSTSTDQLSSFSNMGTCVDIIAPGSGIRSAFLNNSYLPLSGTSMASPHVAGVAALYLESNPTARASQVTSMLTHNSSMGLVSNPGNGTPNRLLFSQITDSLLPPVLTTNSVNWLGAHGIADRWGFLGIFGNHRDLYVTHRNNGEFYATQLNRDGTVQNWHWSGGHGLANRWSFANVFGQNRDVYVTHRNGGQFYATQLNSDGTHQNWNWRGGHGFADRWFMADVFGIGKDVYVTHRNNGQFYATQLNNDGTLKNWNWSGGHGVADRWFAADIFGDGREVYVTHRSRIAYATRINSDGTLKNWTWSGVHGYANRWFVADIFGDGRKVYVTHRNDGQFYATQFNEDGTVTNWYWSGGHGYANRAAFVDYFGSGQQVYVTHRDSGEIYVTQLNKDGTLTNWTGDSHGIANRWGFANLFGENKDEYATHRNNGEMYVTEAVLQ